MSHGQIHLSTEQLLDYLEGRLSPEATSRIEDHLAGDCASCRDELALLQATINRMVADAWLSPPDHLSQAVRQAYRDKYSNKSNSIGIRDWFRGLSLPRPQVAIALAAVLVMILAGALIFQLFLSQTSADKVAAVAVEGTVVQRDAKDEIWQPLDLDDTLSSGDLIRTGRDSSVVLSFADNSLAMLDPGTELAILRVSSSPDGSRQVTILRQDIGRSHHQVQPLPSSDSRYEIHTPTAVVSVHGTAFTVEVAENGDTNVAVAEGTVNVAADGSSVDLLEGQGTTVTADHAPEPAETLSPRPTAFVFTRTSTSVEDDSTVAPAFTDTATATRTPSRTPTVTRTPTRTPTWTPTATPPTVVGPTSGPESTSVPGESTVEATEPPLPTAVTPTPTEPPLPTVASPEPTATPEEDGKKTPPGHTRTPQPPGQTNTPEPPGDGINKTIDQSADRSAHSNGRRSRN